MRQEGLITPSLTHSSPGGPTPGELTGFSQRKNTFFLDDSRPFCNLKPGSPCGLLPSLGTWELGRRKPGVCSQIHLTQTTPGDKVEKGRDWGWFVLFLAFRGGKISQDWAPRERKEKKDFKVR